MESISQRVPDARPAPPGSCDLTVAVDPDRADLEQAWSALREGGALYTEWYSLRRRGAGGVRRRLEAAGFEEVACYWPRPDPSFAPARAWLPLESRAALRFFFTERVPPRNLVRRVGRVFRRAGRLLRPRLRQAVPICAIARKPGEPNGDAPGRAARSPLETVKTVWEGAFGPPGEISWLLLTGGRRSLNKAVALAFGAWEDEPRIAVKMTRIPESVPALAREASTLAALHARPGGTEGVPGLLFCERYGGMLALGETAVIGSPLADVLRAENFAGLARRGTDWLVALAGRGVPCPPGLWRDRLVEPVIARFEENFGAVSDAGLLRDARQILATLGPLPLVCEQRDFSPWNVLVTGEAGLAVLDWESSEPQGLPGCDLIYFLTYLGLVLDRALRTGGVRESYRAMLDPTSRTGSIAAHCLSTYWEKVGLCRSALTPLRVLVWMLHSRSEYEHLAADVAGRPSLEALRQGLFVGFWEEEVRHAIR